MQAKGLLWAVLLNNAIVLDDEKVINKEGLRFADELSNTRSLMPSEIYFCWNADNRPFCGVQVGA
jgi:hypothetical protein